MNKLSSSGAMLPGILIPTKKQETPSIDYVKLESGEKKEQTLFSTEIIFVTEGQLFLSYDHLLDQKIGTGKILLLPPGCHFTVRTETCVSILVFRIKEAIRFCGEYSITHVPCKKHMCENDLYSLDSKPTLENFITFLRDNMERGLRNEEYLKLKAKELLYLLRSYYTSEELGRFFHPLLSPDVQFHQFILRSYREVKTVREFAELSNCSVSNFDKKFKGSFGTSAYQWMQQRKVDLLYHEINMTDKPLRQIAKEQKFLSLPQFSDYCKKHFGYPPGKMRKLAKTFRAEKNVL